LLFGAVNATSDRNKGFDLLKESLNYLKRNVNKKIEFIVFGADKPEINEDFGYTTTYLGIIKDENRLVEIYNAADLVIVPSRSENFSNLILESMACGTPVVGFNIGGNSDLIDHKKNGYLAKPFEISDIANGIVWCLDHNADRIFSEAAQKKAEDKFGINKIISEYKGVYKKGISG
jgi:glycosyltransferase involved in cell wall biosynthesis